MRFMGLLLRGKTWYTRRAIPRALRPLAGGRTEVVKSLRTSNAAEARILALRANITIEQWFNSLRTKAKAALPTPEELAALHEREALADFTADQKALRSEDDLRGQEYALDDYRERLMEALEAGDHTIMSKLLTSVLTAQGLHLTQAQRPAYEAALLKADLRVNVRMAERISKEQRGDDSSEPITLGELLEAYCRERQLRPKSEAEIRSMWGRFVAAVGDKPASEVTKADCRSFKSSLLSTKSDRKLSKDGRLSTASITKVLSRISTVLTYAVNNGLLEHSPMAGGLARIVRGNGGEQTPTRLPYDDGDLKALFGCEAFRALQGAQKFIPLLSVVAGLRREEAASLRVGDLKTEDGIHYVDLVVTPERHLKSASSVRRVPIHSLLVTAGLLEHASGQRQDGLLFPELKPGPRGERGDALGKWWRRYAILRGVTSPLKTLHSGRHTFRLACRTAGVSMETANFLMGHATPGIGARYGGPPSVKVLAEAMERLRFPGLGPC